MKKTGFTMFSLALACAGFVFLPGCGTSEEKADRDARAAVDANERDRAQEQTKESPDLGRIQQKYDTLASPANLSALSKQMQVIVRARQSQIRMERIMMMVADLRAKELIVGQDIDDIQHLAMQVASAQASTDTLKSYEPTAEIGQLKAQQAMIQGSADKLTWDMSGPAGSDSKSSSPTLFALDNEIKTLTDKIQQNQADSEAAKKLSISKSDESETLARRAEGELGENQVADTTKAAEARRDAAMADTKVDVLKVQMQQLQANLDRAKDQKGVLENSIKSLDTQISAEQDRWTSIQQQIAAQQDVQKTLIVASGKGSVYTLEGRVNDLNAQMSDAAKLRDGVTTELAAAIPQLQTTVQQCGLLRNDWLKAMREKADDPDSAIWKQALETLHPMYFNMDLANAMQAKASVAAAKYRIDKQINDLIEGYSVNPADAAQSFKTLNVTSAKPVPVPGLKALLETAKTFGVSIQKSFAGLTALESESDQLKQAKDETIAAYDDAIKTFDDRFGATDSGPSADQRKNVALLGSAAANREAAKFAQLIGDSAKAQNYISAAADAESQIDPAYRQLATVAPPLPTPAPSATPTAPGTATPGATGPGATPTVR